MRTKAGRMAGLERLAERETAMRKALADEEAAAMAALELMEARIGIKRA